MFQWIQSIMWVSKIIAWFKSFRKVAPVEQPPAEPVKQPAKARKPRPKKPRTTTPKQ